MDIQPKSEVIGRGLCPVCKVDRNFLRKPKKSYPCCEKCGAMFFEVPPPTPITETKA